MPFGAKDTADGEFTFIGPARREVTVTVKNTRAVEHRYVK
jgi:hypothetical protein